MNHTETIKQLLKNRGVFTDLLSGLEKDHYLWKPTDEKWCLLEVVCHLYDEEREDFKARLRHVLKTPDLPLPEIKPEEWPAGRNYMTWNYEETLEKFRSERIQSVEWLSELKSPSWKNAYLHPKLGVLSAELLLANWLAHDHLHIRQIIHLKYHFHKHLSQTDLSYAGVW
jgi:hypothetical protein